MISQTKKKIDKIYGQIDKIAKKGKDYVLEYYKLIDDIVDKGDYAYLEQCLVYYYEIDIVNYPSVDQVKKKTWKDIRFKTVSSFSQKLYKMYQTRGVYQISFNIHLSSTNALLGQIREIEEFTQDSKYLIENQEFAKLMGQKRAYLEVTIGGVITYIDNNDPSVSEDVNLLSRYGLALDLLLD
jgi:hypothetical protein